MSNNREIAEKGLAAVLRESAGLEISQMDRSANFLELGFDSLFLIQMSQRLKRKLGVKVAFRQLIEEVSSVDALVDYLAASGTLTASAIQNSAPAAAPAAPTPVQPAAVAATPASVAPPRSQPTSSAQSRPTQVQPAPAQPTYSQPRPVQLPMPQSIPAAMPAAYGVPTSPAPSTLANHFQTAPLSIGGTLPAASPIEQIIMQQNAMMMRHLDLMYGSMSTAAPSPQPISYATPSVPMAPAEAFQAQYQSPTQEHPTQEHPTQEHPTQEHPTQEHPTQEQCETACSMPQCDDLPDCSDAETANGGTGSTISKAVESFTAADARPAKKFERFGPYKPIRKGLNNGLTDQQQRYLQRFMERYLRRTPKCRQHAQSYRANFADPREVASYRRIWKSMVYQITVERSKGSKLWDIDGNEYIDIAMGFGLNLFGQSPDFITAALHKQLDRGVEVGPQTPIAGEAAALLCQFARKDRATFCNTGSEAVMAALRLARLVNGKSKTVFFNKDYHGNFDQVLLRSGMSGGKPGSAPAAPGVAEVYSDNTIVLTYGSEESLRIIDQYADEIAAVLVEPCQSADPFIQPREFLHELRRITRERNIALIMDEVITGFRAAQGGAQEWYGVWGDMSTYGKILGGGMPIGALAGSAEYMNGLDGGFWNYDDDSEPDADMTFFAGTFVRHPLAIVAAYEVLKKIKEEGPQLQQQLTQKTEYLANTLNRFFETEQFPIRVAQFSSLFRFMFPPDLEFADMLYFHLLEKGVFTRGWGDNCFLSTAHSAADIQRVIKAVMDSCLEIRGGGFFPDKDGAIPSPGISSTVTSSTAMSSTAMSSTAMSSPAMSSPAMSSPAMSSPAMSSPEMSSPEMSSPGFNSDEHAQTEKKKLFH